ncbi:cytochrome b [Betaproteobacteria bacterium]|nr:cytochrome b [Betaproteobacteria bacterium]
MSKIGKKPINSFNNTAILLHWLVAFLLMVQFLIGLDMVDIPKGPDSPRPFWFNTHKSIGIVLGCLILFRLYWRIRSGVPQSPAGTVSWERIAANISHMLLYFCMFIMPVSGLVGSLFSKYDLLFLGIRIPKFFEHDALIKELMTNTHQWTAYIFLAIISIHILAAVKHLVIDCDGIFERMMPNFTNLSNSSGEKTNGGKS